MIDFLILKLQGPMQAWGDHTFEGLRPISFLPTRSGVIGLLGACLGIYRNEKKKLGRLNSSIGMAVQAERKKIGDRNIRSRVERDYHTVMDARDGYRGLKSHKTIVTNREYLYDAIFTLALWQERSEVTLSELEAAVKAPRFTPFLGRKSCPLSRPLFEARISAENEVQALLSITENGDEIYSENDLTGSFKPVRSIVLRDVPTNWGARQFTTRTLYAYSGRQ